MSVQSAPAVSGESQSALRGLVLSTPAGGLDESAVREAINKLLDAGELTQVTLSRESGVHQARLNQWLKGVYKGNTGEIAQALSQWLDGRSQRQAAAVALPTIPDWLPTPTAERILSVLRYSHITAGLGVVYGGAGLGKTLTCEHYAATSPNVWHVEMGRWDRSMGECLLDIAKAVGLRNILGAGRLAREIIQRLRGTGGLLLIDEAQHLGLDALEAVRAIHDQAAIGLVLLGNESVFSQLTGGSRAAEFSQLYRRVGKRQRLDKPEARDIAMLCAAWRIDAPAIKERLRAIAEQPGGLGGVTEVLCLGHLLAHGEGEPLSERHVQQAWIDVGART